MPFAEEFDLLMGSWWRDVDICRDPRVCPREPSARGWRVAFQHWPQRDGQVGLEDHQYHEVREVGGEDSEARVSTHERKVTGLG